jgi:hypothetical protein
VAKKVRTNADLSVHDGEHRSFEWFWAGDEAMPGLDAFESLSRRDQDDLLASVVHWGGVEAGKRPAQSRVNQENENPLIIAIKAGKHRFTAFREESGPTWVLCDHYLKEGEKRDKTGDRAVKRTVEKRAAYFEAVRKGEYYERG